MSAVEKTNSYLEWYTPGNKRTVYFKTDDTSTEEILECDVPNYFKYKVYNFTLSARYFVKMLTGEWQYNIFPKSFIHRLFILNFFKNSRIPYME